MHILCFLLGWLAGAVLCVLAWAAERAYEKSRGRRHGNHKR